MSKYSVICLLLVALTILENGQAQDQCGKNQQFNECGTTCPNRCNEDASQQKICTLQCISGCQCKPGYLLNAKDECVSRSEC